jgi:nuclear polyadenylated RNA-binding protein NAB2
MSSPSSYPALSLDVKAPSTALLQSSVQIKLAELGYSTADDPVMAEYIVVMLANRKGAEQVSEEMKDLIGEEYDPSFVNWLWKEAEIVVLNGGEPTTKSAGASRPAEDAHDRSRSRSPERKRSNASAHRDGDEEIHSSRRSARRSRSPYGDRRQERQR